MQFTNKHNLPETIVAAIVSDRRHEKKPSVYSVTEIAGSPLIAALRRIHDNEITVDVSEFLWMLYGSGVHYRLEKAAKSRALAHKVLTEHWLEIDVDGRTVRGIADVLIMDVNGHWRLEDHKTTSVWAAINLDRGAKDEWVRQANYYAFMAEAAGFRITDISVNMILRDWKESEAMRGGDYPPVAFSRITLPMWPHDKTLAGMRQRIQALEANINALKNGDEPPYPCSKEERWQSDDVWAVKKRGNKRAVRGGLKTNEAEAHEMAAQLERQTGHKHIVEFRPSEPKRCARCDVRNFCPIVVGEVIQAEAAGENGGVTDDHIPIDL